MIKTGTKVRLGEYASIASPKGGYSPFVMRFILQECAREILPNERVSECLRKQVPLKSVVEIRKAEGSRHAHYTGLVICSRVWFCAVCASRITEERRKDLHTAFINWQGGLAMASYTASHNTKTSLPEFLSGLSEAFRAFKSGKVFAEIKDRYGWIGSVRSLEVTHGDNGWHPHLHELIFFSNTLSTKDADTLEFALKGHWMRVLDRFGMSCSFSHGLDLKTTDSAIRDYIVKWGHEPINTGWTPAHEITKQVSKKAAKDGKTPTQLLYDYWEGDMEARKLWKEYAMTFKGKHQLQWTPGLRKFLKMGEEKTDEELAEAVPKDAVLLATLTRDQWQGVLWANCVGEILEKAGYMSEENFALYLADITTKWTHRYD